jgi:type I restriction enzyme S subunit
MRLGDFIDLKRGYDLPKKSRSAGPIPLVSSAGVSDQHSEAKVRGPGVVTGRYGTIGDVFYIEEDFWPLNTTLYVRDFKGNDPRFTYYFLKTIDYLQYSDKAAVPGVNRNHLHMAEISVPKSVDEQRRIASVLSCLDDKIEANDTINQTLEQMAQAIFKSWFVDFEPVKAKIAALEAGGSAEDALLGAMQAISGKGEAELTRLQAEQPEQYAELRATAELFPAAMQDSELGEIPEGWEPAPLSELFELHRGFDLPQKSREEGPYEVYAAGGLHGTHSQYKMEPPGIITGRSGVIGNVYLSLKKYWPLNTTLYVRQFRSCGPYYAYHLLKTLDLKTLNSGSAVPSLNRNFVHSISVINPGSTVLNKFESLSSSLFEQVVQNIDQNELLSTLRDTLLPKLLSGELSVSTAEDQLAEAVEPANV